MTIREWKQQAADLVNDFQFASEIPALEALLEAAKEIAAERENKKMNVCIVHTIERLDKGYQIMYRVRSGFNHVFPGVLFTLDEAKAECEKYNYNIVAVGDMWQCLH